EVAAALIPAKMRDVLDGIFGFFEQRACPPDADMAYILHRTDAEGGAESAGKLNGAEKMSRGDLLQRRASEGGGVDRRPRPLHPRIAHSLRMLQTALFDSVEQPQVVHVVAGIASIGFGPLGGEPAQ